MVHQATGYFEPVSQAGFEVAGLTRFYHINKCVYVTGI